MFSQVYLQQLIEVHNDKSRRKGFGGKNKNLGKFSNYMKTWQVKTLLDYGCGKGHILAQLKESYPGIKIQGYDPAVKHFSDIPTQSFDCVFSNDVLEHIEPKFIDDVLVHIDRLSDKYIWLRIDTKPARKKLSDGRNAHLIIEDLNWWQNKIVHNIQGSIDYIDVNAKGKLDVAITK